MDGSMQTQEDTRSSVAFCKVCGSAIRAGGPCPHCVTPPPAPSHRDDALVRSLGITSLVLGIAAASGTLHLMEQLAPLLRDAVAAIVVGALPAFLAAVLGAAGVFLARRDGAASWPYAAGGVLVSLLALLLAVLMAVELAQAR